MLINSYNNISLPLPGTLFRPSKVMFPPTLYPYRGDIPIAKIDSLPDPDKYLAIATFTNSVDVQMSRQEHYSHYPPIMYLGTHLNPTNSELIHFFLKESELWFIKEVTQYHGTEHSLFSSDNHHFQECPLSTQDT